MIEKSYLNNTIGGKTVVDKIVDNIANAIINGELKPGEKLPTEKELCESMDVGRNSVREAIKILEAYGVVHIRRAEGTFVNKEYDSKMLYPILYGIILQEDYIDQMIELRKVIDIGVLQVAASKISEKSLETVRQSLRNLEGEILKPNPDPELIFEVDAAFHEAIFSVTDNILLKSICNYVDNITRKSRIYANEEILKLNEVDKFIDLHRRMVNVIAEKQIELVPLIVTEHYQFWEDVI